MPTRPTPSHQRIGSVAVCCHDAAYGPPHYLRDHLRAAGASRVVFIGHVHQAAPDSSSKSSYLQIFEASGRGDDYCPLAREIHAFIRLRTEFVGYFVDFVRTLAWCLFKVPGRIELFVGAGNLNALAGLFLRSVGKVRRVAYYVIDYVPDRFANRIVNAIYNHVEKWAARFSDVTWNYSDVMIRRRQERWGGRFPNQIVTPHGIVPRWKERDPAIAAGSRQLIYFGFVHPHQGCELSIAAMPEILERFPEASLLIIGHCDPAYREVLDRRIDDLAVSHAVSFTGMIPSHDDAERLLLRGAIGVAMYSDDHPFIRNADPGKVKSYLACGLPVVMTHVGAICDRLLATGAGAVIPYDRDALVKTVTELFSNESELMEMSERAGRLSENYRWTAIFSAALDAVP